MCMHASTHKELIQTDRQTDNQQIYAHRYRDIHTEKEKYRNTHRQTYSYTYKH